MRLTEAGERLLAKARRMLAVNDEIWDDDGGAPAHRPRSGSACRTT